MKASELRIGNLVQSKPLSIPRLEISSDGVMTVTGYGISVIESDIDNKLGIEPILLTEEWLLKLGAYKVGIEYNLKASALKLTIRINSGHVYCEFGNVYLGGRIKYVHQLQNLFHALCGKELEVTI